LIVNGGIFTSEVGCCQDDGWSGEAGQSQQVGVSITRPRIYSDGVVSSERVRARARERIELLACAPLSSEEARRGVIDVLRPVIGFGRWCWPLTDPGSCVSTSGIAEFDLWSQLPRIAALEEHGDILSKPDLARAPRVSISVSVATGGELGRSTRWSECLSPFGVGDELMTICRDRHGAWGSVELMRDSDDPPFTEADMNFLHDLSPLLAALIRSGSEATSPALRDDDQLSPATLLVDAQLRPTNWTAAFRQWLRELPTGAGVVPPAVYELGTRVLVRREKTTDLPASVRIRTRSGHWAVLEAAALEGATRERAAAITIRRATSDEIFDILVKTYDLTRRERQLVALMLDGLATKQLAAALNISPHTVQDHLKGIFAKTHLRSRRELVSHLAGRKPGGAGRGVLD
jgi:DNA-binding CsgD family transcriptional regulator